MDEKGSQETREEWDRFAASFDDEPDHGLRDPIVREQWTNFLRACLPETRSAVLDIGCGTGSLSVVLAELGHTVTGIDLSPAMISLARTKAEAREVRVEFQVMDAASPRLPKENFDVIVCRHLLWTLPEPGEVLERWAALLKPNGRLILIEGHWGTGAGLHARQIIEVLPGTFESYSLQDLSDDPRYWGREVSDERYAIIADKSR